MSDTDYFIEKLNSINPLISLGEAVSVFISPYLSALGEAKGLILR